jgi:tetratricopeptide (TPR) repeat protein
MRKPALIVCMLFGLVKAALCQVSTDEQLAAQYYSNKEYDKAITYYEKIYSKHPTNTNYRNYVDCYVQLKDYKNAEKIVKKQIRYDDIDQVLWLDLGTIYLLEAEEKQAKDAFEKAIHNLTNDRNQILAVGQGFVDIKQYEYALQTYKKGKSLTGGNYPFIFETAAVYKAMGNAVAMTDTYLDALIISPSYIQTVQDALQISVGENADETQNTVVKKELLKYSQKYTDNEIFAELLIWLMIQQKDYATALIELKGLDKRKHEMGYRVMSLARTCVHYEAYDVAIQAYQYVIDIGKKGDYYAQAKSELLKVMYDKLVSGGNYTHQDLLDLQGKYKEALGELGENASTVQLMMDKAYLEGFYLDEGDSATDLLNRAIGLPNVPQLTRAHCQMELADVLVAQGSVWEASLTYSKVQDAFKQDPIGEEARLKNAVVYFYTGNFKWAKAQLDVLKAATSKPTANDAMALALTISDNTQDSATLAPLRFFAHAMLFDFQNREDSAVRLLDSVEATHLATPTLKEQVIMMRASIAMKRANYTDVVKYYEEETKDYPTGLLPDKALYLMAQLQEKKLKNPDKAADYYKQIILNYPGSFYVQDARDRYRHLSKTDAEPAPIN